MRNPGNETVAAPNPPSRLREGSGEGLSPAPPLADAPSPNPSRKREGNPRTCILTRDAAPRDALVRLALSPDGDILPDVAAKAPGRGAWIGVTRDALETAIAKGKLRGALARAFKGAPVAIPADLPGRVAAALERRALDRLGLEARAGHLLTGAERIEAAARGGQVHALYHAADAGEDGARKLSQAWRVGQDSEGSDLKGLALPFPRTILSLALGRENVVHIAVTDRAAAARVSDALGRWLRYVGFESFPAPCGTAPQGASAPGPTGAPTLNTREDTE